MGSGRLLSAFARSPLLFPVVLCVSPALAIEFAPALVVALVSNIDLALSLVLALAPEFAFALELAVAGVLGLSVAVTLDSLQPSGLQLQ